MADDSMALLDSVRKAIEEGDGDFLRETVHLLAQGVMEAEVTELTGVPKGERAPDRRLTSRNGYRERRWDTRVGTIDLAIPRVRDGNYFPSLLEPRRRAERALLAVVQEAYVLGVSIRRVDDLVQSLGITGISKSEVSRICSALDTEVETFRKRPIAFICSRSMVDFCDSYLRIADEFLTNGIPVEAPGFYDHKNFLVQETKNPDYLSNYA